MKRKERKGSIDAGGPASRIQSMIARDLPYIIVIILMLGACIYTLDKLGDAMQTCNDYWTNYTTTYCVCSEHKQNEWWDYGMEGLYKNAEGQS